MSPRVRRVIISTCLCVFVLLGLFGIGLAAWDPEPPGAPNAVVLRIGFGGGGQWGPAYSSTGPGLTVYGDGQILGNKSRHDGIVPDSVVMDARLSRDAYREMYRDALLAGLGTGRRYEEDEPIMDGESLDIGFLSGGRWHVTRVPQGAGGVREWMIRRLVSRMNDLKDGTDDLVHPPAPYRPERMAIVAWRPEETSYGRRITTERPWPLHPLAQGRPYPGQRSVTCTVLTGRDIQVAEELAKQQPRLGGASGGAVGWRSGDHVYLVNFRPLLADEKDCTTLPVR
jgi:hypothetical protein